jgi:hypothetical protein
VQRMSEETGTPRTRVDDDLSTLCSSLVERGLIEAEPAT